MTKYRCHNPSAEYIIMFDFIDQSGKYHVWLLPWPITGSYLFLRWLSVYTHSTVYSELTGIYLVMDVVTFDRILLHIFATFGITYHGLTCILYHMFRSCSGCVAVELLLSSWLVWPGEWHISWNSCHPAWLGSTLCLLSCLCAWFGWMKTKWKITMTWCGTFWRTFN